MMQQPVCADAQLSASDYTHGAQALAPACCRVAQNLQRLGGASALVFGLFEHPACRRHPPESNMVLRTYLVEDNPVIRENLIDTLAELANVKTVGASSTEGEGCHWLTRNGDEWDLAIVDLFLREGNGLGVLASCMDRRPQQKVVVLSNYATPEMRSRCMALKADAVFDKSNEIDALLDYCMHQALNPGTH
jgi:CheY-like chemotaxis protein